VSEAGYVMYNETLRVLTGHFVELKTDISARQEELKTDINVTQEGIKNISAMKNDIEDKIQNNMSAEKDDIS
jgi:hypothetical protein